MDLTRAILLIVNAQEAALQGGDQVRVTYLESEVASSLGISERTVRRDWIKARALLSSHI